VSKIFSSAKAIWRTLSNKTNRDDFVFDTVDDSIAVQVYSMRRRRGWTQEALAENTGTKQSGVCRWENGEPPQSLTTLKKIAAAFDVGLIVRFVPFSEMVQGDSQPVDKHVPSFNEDRLRDTVPRIRAFRIYTTEGYDWPIDEVGATGSQRSTMLPSRRDDAGATWLN
jgi:transcriptional regulator with XRE-family HTH domain